MKAVNIDWDIDDIEREDVELPQEIFIPSSYETDGDIADYITDLTGFCVNGFEVVENTFGKGKWLSSMEYTASAPLCDISDETYDEILDKVNLEWLINHYEDYEVRLLDAALLNREGEIIVNAQLDANDKVIASFAFEARNDNGRSARVDLNPHIDTRQWTEEIEFTMRDSMESAKEAVRKSHQEIDR